MTKEDPRKRARQAAAALKLLSQHGLHASPAGDGRLVFSRNGKALMTLPQSLMDYLQKEDLVERQGGRLLPTQAGRAWLARQGRADDAFLAQQQVTQAVKMKDATGTTEQVTIHLRESPLAWLRARKGRDGGPLISDVQFTAGEKLRADFTRAQLSPRVTSGWDFSSAQRQRGLPFAGEFSEGTLAAKQRVDGALKAVGAELNGVLLDVCCFLKSLSDVESERRWPARTAKVVLALALDRLAQHYGLVPQASGASHKTIRSWGSDDYRPVIQY